ncbi:MAG: ferrous iron transport protein A [Cyclobacteriaceae bacterium]
MRASELPINKVFYIHAILESSIQVQMLELGILVGKQIKLQHKAPFSGAMAYEIDQTRVCIRLQEAELIEVGEEENISIS